MEDLVPVYERRLREAGKRITPQRQLVLRVLAGVDGHLDAQEIYERGRRSDSRLSLSTVYRTLSALKETGAVRELHLEGEQHHYELDKKKEHSHLVCLGCGRVIEVDSTAFEAAAAAACEDHGFQVTTAQVELTGYCAWCLEERSE
ncbi:MAG: transcriptional repressor [Anaerolineae bacterium]|nr:transcriptional repressor [Anaerolineae bacterium]MDX9829994.1 transcriptional repressor [Anaerolineae bacterium]